MAMAAGLVAAPSVARVAAGASWQPSAEAFSGPRNAVEHGGRGVLLRRRWWDVSACRGPAEPAAAAAAGLSSSGRDGGACCGAISRSSGGGSSRNAAELGWRACSGGLLRLDVSGLSALRQRRDGTAVPRRLTLRVFAEKPDLTNGQCTSLHLPSPPHCFDIAPRVEILESGGIPWRARGEFADYPICL